MDNLDLNRLKLVDDFVTNGSYPTGNWNTTFKIQPVESERELEFSKDFGTWTVNRLTVSPLGITLYGKGESNDESSDLAVSAKMKDGSIQTFDSIEVIVKTKKLL